MNRDMRRLESSAKLSTLLNELETALPALAGTASLVQMDWSDLDRRLNGVRSILAAGKHRRRRPRRVRSASATGKGRADGPIASLFG